MPVRPILIGRSVALVFEQRLTRDGNGLIQVRVEAGSRSGGGRDKGLDERQVLVCRDAVIEAIRSPWSPYRRAPCACRHQPIGRPCSRWLVGARPACSSSDVERDPGRTHDLIVSNPREVSSRSTRSCHRCRKRPDCRKRFRRAGCSSSNFAHSRHTPKVAQPSEPFANAVPTGEIWAHQLSSALSTAPSFQSAEPLALI
jgi:hypothetical protein